ncbi:peptidoglycan recognition protein family protein [Streptomyces sanyensis]|uniref:peptidoglycan recognition protein family protein n=1 Tax=Streptomyces sanyensis TaxID=568869 RepID=UPI003D77A784
MDLIPRSAWGARAYRTPNGAITYSGPRRGVKLHYLGTPYSDRAHDRCAAYVRALQASHMDGNGWSDIGYSFVVCTHGAVYEGRGLRRRNSANGNTALNEQDYAVLLLVGSSGLTQPTTAQLRGARDAIDYCRTEGPAGAWLGGHRDGYATSCPGDAVYAWAKAGAPRPADDTPTPKETTGMELTDHVQLGAWLPKRWPDDKGLADGVISVNTALASGYGYSRAAAEESAAARTAAEESAAALRALATERPAPDLTPEQLDHIADRIGERIAAQVVDLIAARLAT